MTKKYDFSFIEKKWQTIWENEKTFDAKIDKSKKIVDDEKNNI